MVQANMAIELVSMWKALRDFVPDSMYFAQPMFTAAEFAEKLERVLTDKSYRINALRLKVACKAQGGASLAVRTIENVYVQSAFAVKDGD